VNAEVHHNSDVAHAARERTDASGGGGHQVSVLSFVELSFHDRDRGIVSLDVSHREREPSPFGRVDEPLRFRHGRREGFLHEDGNAGLDDVESHFGVVLGRDADADRIEPFLEEVLRVRVIRYVKTVRDRTARLHVRIRDANEVRDFGVHTGVVLAHRPDPNDPDAHRRRHASQIRVRDINARRSSASRSLNAMDRSLSKPSYPLVSSALPSR